MNTPPLTLVIATAGRPPLLERTLTSLAALRRILIVENGPAGGIEPLLQKFQSRLPIEYHHVATACKSAALNHALRSSGRDLVIFFDDDIRAERDALIAYSDAAAEGSTEGVFFGGRCLVDYEEEPPEWLIPYLPLSAKGWSLGDERCVFTVPEALGFNWAGYASDLRAAGGFDETQGPGCNPPIGEETQLQEILLRRGVTGLYLPTATVWHFVPRERCSPEWALRRAQQMGQWAGLRLGRISRWHRFRLQVACLVRLVYFHLLLRTFLRRWSAERRFYFQQRWSWGRGLHKGLQMLPH
jgi:glycosyltransferase involved in cell wall biosynthesis